MTPTELRQYLDRLELTSFHASQLLGVNPKTVRRWREGEEVPGPAAQAIRAWIRLHDRGLAWRPDLRTVQLDDQDQIKLYREHACKLSDLLARVEARGGVRYRWKVDFNRGRATAEPFIVSFHRLQNGSVDLAYYTRTDIDPDPQRDAETIEEAFCTIVLALQQGRNHNFGPVVLHALSLSPKRGIASQHDPVRFDTVGDALAHVLPKLGGAGFVEPFITTEWGHLLLDHHDLEREFARRESAPAALRALADFVRTHAGATVRTGSHLPTPEVAERLRRKVEGEADKLSELAKLASKGEADYRDFDAILGRLNDAGLFPDSDLVNEVAQKFGLC